MTCGGRNGLASWSPGAHRSSSSGRVLPGLWEQGRASRVLVCRVSNCDLQGRLERGPLRRLLRRLAQAAGRLLGGTGDGTNHPRARPPTLPSLLHPNPSGHTRELTTRRSKAGVKTTSLHFPSVPHHHTKEEEAGKEQKRFPLPCPFLQLCSETEMGSQFCSSSSR